MVKKSKRGKIKNKKMKAGAFAEIGIMDDNLKQINSNSEYISNNNSEYTSNNNYNNTSNILGLQRIYRFPITNIDINKLSTLDSIYVLWVRHCWSCANFAETKEAGNNIGTRGLSKEWHQVKEFREPLCYTSGNRNDFSGLHLPIKLGKYLSTSEKWSRWCQENLNLSSQPKTYNYYASYLPRATETCIGITYGAGLEGSQKKINRLCYINEEVKFYDRSKKNLAKSGFDKSSQSTTTLAKSDTFSQIFNKLTNGLKIYISDDKNTITSNQAVYNSNSWLSKKKTRKKKYLCEPTLGDDWEPIKGNQIPISGKSEKNIGEDYIDFLKNSVLGLSNNNNQILEPGRINLVVSHGGYIRMNVLGQHDKNFHPDNTQSYLVKYSLDNNKDKFFVKSELMKIIHPNDFSDIEVSQQEYDGFFSKRDSSGKQLPQKFQIAANTMKDNSCAYKFNSGKDPWKNLIYSGSFNYE